MAHDQHNWLAASPDGILDSTQLLEVKCPLTGSTSLEQFLSRPNADVRFAMEGQGGPYIMIRNGQNGYYQQVGN